jgi:hypothetical protein
MLAHITSSPIVLYSVALICIIDFANLRYFRYCSDVVLILVLGSGVVVNVGTSVKWTRCFYLTRIDRDM